MRVLTYNIHKGFSALPGRFTLARMRQHLHALDPDLMLLQEVQGSHARKARRVKGWAEAQGEFLADTRWPHVVYGRNAVYDHGHHGNAILSKHDIPLWENIDISNHRLERRGLLHAVIHAPGMARDLHVICLHFDLTAHGRARQVRRLAARIAAAVPADAPLLVAGDFNDYDERAGDVLEAELGLTEIHKALHGRHAVSFPSWYPLLALDRIYCRGLIPQSARCLTGKPWSALSDHGALLAELTPA
jgi:endonuclease/exonuclease/phosphatase family metal-dependent hydrolase